MPKKILENSLIQVELQKNEDLAEGGGGSVQIVSVASGKEEDCKLGMKRVGGKVAHQRGRASAAMMD